MKQVVLLSGGMDSATVLGMLCVFRDSLESDQHNEIIALNLTYGQKHIVEAECARQLAEHYGVLYIQKDISQVFDIFKSSLLKEPIFDNEEKAKVGGTYVPARNIIFLAIAAGIAESLGAEEVYYGAHAEDGEGYPDCSPKFIEYMARAITQGTVSRVRINAPYMLEPKSKIVEDGMTYGVPFELTSSCYRGERPGCGTCPTCIQRAKAFKEAGYEDICNKRDNI